MNLKKRDILLGIAVLLQGSALFGNVLMQDLKHQSWIGFIIAMIIMIAVLYFFGNENNLYSKLYQQFGVTGGRILSGFYIIYLIGVAAFYIKLLSSFIGGYVLEETPTSVFIIFFLLLCAYGVYKGVENLFRLSAVFFTVIIITEILNSFLLWDKIEFKNFMPVYIGNITDYIKNIFFSFLLLFGDMSICFSFSGGVTKKTLISGFIAGSVLAVLIIIRTIGALGVMIPVYTWPVHESLRIINSGNVMTRIETSTVFILIGTLFYKICLFYGGAWEGVKKVFGIKNKKYGILFVGIIIAVLSLLITESGEESLMLWRRWAPFTILPIVGGIITILKIKRNKCNKTAR